MANPPECWNLSNVQAEREAREDAKAWRLTEAETKEYVAQKIQDRLDAYSAVVQSHD